MLFTELHALSQYIKTLFYGNQIEMKKNNFAPAERECLAFQANWKESKV